MQIAIYADKLVSYRSNIVRRAVDDAIETCTRFPTLAELIRFLNNAKALSDERTERAKAGPKINYQDLEAEQPTVPEHDRERHADAVMRSDWGQRALAEGWGWVLHKRALLGYDCTGFDGRRKAQERQRWNDEVDAMNPVPPLMAVARNLSATLDRREAELRQRYLREVAA